MDFQAIDLSLNKFSGEDRAIIDKILTSSDAYATPFNSLNSDELIALVEAHKSEHGISVGLVKDGYGKVLGLAGLHYQPEVALYEIVSIVLPEFKDRAAYIVEYLVFEAFSNLSMDKVFARTPVETADAESFKENGFVCLGERAFAEDDREKIWSYYELENEANLVSVDRRATSHISNDWDSLF